MDVANYAQSYDPNVKWREREKTKQSINARTTIGTR